MATPTNLPSTFVDGNILLASQLNDMRGAFRTLQVVQYTYSTYVTHNSNTYTTTNLTGTITPQSSTSKILVQAFINGTVKGAEAAGNALNLEIKRNSTQIQEVQNLHLTSTAVLTIGTCHIQVLDSPATTSSITYVVNGKNSVNNSTVGTQFGNTKSTLILTEISA
jgi:hypothetical protein